MADVGPTISVSSPDSLGMPNVSRDIAKLSQHAVHPRGVPHGCSPQRTLLRARDSRYLAHLGSQEAPGEIESRHCTLNERMSTLEVAPAIPTSDNRARSYGDGVDARWYLAVARPLYDANGYLLEFHRSIPPYFLGGNPALSSEKLTHKFAPRLHQRAGILQVEVIGDWLTPCRRAGRPRRPDQER